MFEINRYFTSFLSEMQAYLVELRQQTEYLHARFASDEQARLLRQLGHTIAGLSKTVELPDFAGLGEALDEMAARFLAVNEPLTDELAQSLARCADYFMRRLEAMAAARDFVTPTFADIREADAIAVTLIAMAPAMQPGIQVTGIHPPFVETNEEPDDTLSPQMRAAIAAFLRSHLRQATAADTVTAADMSFVDSEVLGDFIVEMGDALTQLSQRLLMMSANGATIDDFRFLGKIAHNLKGAAAQIGMTMSATLSEMFESVVIAARQKRIAANADAMRWLLDCVEILETLHMQIKATRNEGDIQARAGALQSGYTQLFAASQSAPTRPRPSTSQEHTQQGDDSGAATASDAERHQVRIDVHRLDQIMNTLNSFLVNRIALKRLHAQAVVNEEELPGVIARIITLSDRLRAERVATLHTPAGGMRSPAQPSLSTRLAEQRLEATEVANSNGFSIMHDVASYAEFDQLMTMVGEAILDLRTLHLSLQTALNQIHRHSEHLDFFTESIQRDLFELRLVPFGAMAGRLDLVARSAAFRLKKEVDFTIEGAAHEIDRDISTIIVAPLAQLVRNAIVHGIETPTERIAAGKFAPARVVMRVATAGDVITIDISDNGGGINPHQIAATLLSRKDPRMTPERARTFTMDEAIEFILAPDFSTANKAHHLAGSGTGLPYVKEVIESVHGHLRISSETGIGTTFHIHLPVTLSVLRAITAYAGTNGYAIPVGDIRRTTVIAPEMLRTTAAGTFATAAGTFATVPNLIAGVTEMQVITLADLLGHAEIAPTGDMTMALVIAVDDREYAVIVNHLGEERDMVVRKVPQHLHRRHVRGASITTDGEVLLILSLPDLVSKALTAGHFSTRPPRVTAAPATTPQGDYILVVDDSPSIRRGLEQGLTQAGYVVKLARDGVEAIEQMTRIRPRLVILDIEMPNLNGYELLEVIRANVPLNDLRVVMLTSQAGSRHRERALGLGASGYLAKPATTEELIAAVERALDPNAQTAYNQREETS